MHGYNYMHNYAKLKCVFKIHQTDIHDSFYPDHEPLYIQVYWDESYACNVLS